MERSMSTTNKFSIQQMYNISTSQGQTFGIKNYDAKKHYQDPNAQIQERFFKTQRKGQKDNKYFCKRGSYLDPILKVNRKKIPAAVHYNLAYKWPSTHDKSQKSPYPTKINSFIEQTQNNAKKIPGVGKYNITQTEEQKMEEIKNLKLKKQYISDKKTGWDNLEWQSNMIPGAGQYNPHDNVKKPKKPQPWENPKAQIEKSKQTFINKQKCPDMGTYDPCPVLYNTFQSQYSTSQKADGGKKNGFGCANRFPSMTKSKSSKVLIPGPGDYDLIQNWPGKNQTKNSKNWLNKVSKGIEMSLYINQN